MMRLQDPTGQNVDLDPSDVVLIFFSGFLSPQGAHSNAVYRGAIRSFRNNVAEAAAALGATEKVVNLTLPPGAVSRRGPVWIAVDHIQMPIKPGPRGSTLLDIKGQSGPVRVLEAPAVVEAAIKAA